MPAILRRTTVTQTMVLEGGLSPAFSVALVTRAVFQARSPGQLHRPCRILILITTHHPQLEPSPRHDHDRWPDTTSTNAREPSSSISDAQPTRINPLPVLVAPPVIAPSLKADFTPNFPRSLSTTATGASPHAAELTEKRHPRLSHRHRTFRLSPLPHRVVVLFCSAIAVRSHANKHTADSAPAPDVASIDNSIFLTNLRPRRAPFVTETTPRYRYHVALRSHGRPHGGPKPQSLPDFARSAEP